MRTEEELGISFTTFTLAARVGARTRFTAVIIVAILRRGPRYRSTFPVGLPLGLLGLFSYRLEGVAVVVVSSEIDAESAREIVSITRDAVFLWKLERGDLSSIVSLVYEKVAMLRLAYL